MAMTVKEVLQSLVDDSLVVCEKIGTSNYFWSFPSTALHSRKVKLQTINMELERADRSEAELNEALDKARVGREESESRQKALTEYAELGRRIKSLDSQLEAFKENDPILHAARVKDNATKKLDINKWTDNIVTVQSYCSDTFNIDRDRLKEAFDIPSDLEYIQ